MDVRFEDHAGFQRAAGIAAIGSGAVAALAPHFALVPAAAAGSALALAFAPGVSRAARGKRLLAALGCTAVAAAWLADPRPWMLPLSGALAALVFALARAEAAKEAGAKRPSGTAIAIACALAAGAVLVASVALAPLAAALAQAIPGWIASATSGAALGLWAGIAAAPLHVAIGEDAVEARLASLRASLNAELRSLAERAAAARRGAADELPAGARADLRVLLDSLALGALDLAARAGDLGRAAAPAVEEDLQRRMAHLAESATRSEDAAARQSYLRAAQALEGQLDHFRRVRRARERALARLHEDVANLERARFSLTLLRGADAERGGAELDLLHDRLQHGAVAFEEAEELAAPPLRAQA